MILGEVGQPDEREFWKLIVSANKTNVLPESILSSIICGPSGSVLS